MSGMIVSGLIMVQEAQSCGFKAHVYSSRIEAAIQLLRVEIRNSALAENTIRLIEGEVAELISSERADLED